MFERLPARLLRLDALVWIAHIGVDRFFGYGQKVSERLQGHAPPARLSPTLAK